MGKVIKLDTEHWRTIFQCGGLTVRVSSRGNASFMTTRTDIDDSPLPVELCMREMVQLAEALSRNYDDEVS